MSLFISLKFYDRVDLAFANVNIMIGINYIKSLEGKWHKNKYLVSNFYYALKFPALFIVQNKIRITALWAISITNWNLSRFFPTCFARREVREISICCRNYSQGSYSYFDLPLDIFIKDLHKLNIQISYNNAYEIWKCYIWISKLLWNLQNTVLKKTLKCLASNTISRNHGG